jgi:hypothetical protein
MRKQTVKDYVVGAHLRAGAMALFVKMVLNFVVTVGLACFLTTFVIVFDGLRYLYEKVTNQV